MSKKYAVCANAWNFGIVLANSEQEARDACARDAGYESEAQMAETLEQPSELVATEVEEWEAWIDDESEAVRFHAPVSGTLDISAAAAGELGVSVSEELNVRRV